MADELPVEKQNQIEAQLTEANDFAPTVENIPYSTVNKEYISEPCPTAPKVEGNGSNNTSPNGTDSNDLSPHVLSSGTTNEHEPECSDNDKNDSTQTKGNETPLTWAKLRFSDTQVDDTGQESDGAKEDELGEEENIQAIVENKLSDMLESEGEECTNTELNKIVPSILTNENRLQDGTNASQSSKNAAANMSQCGEPAENVVNNKTSDQSDQPISTPPAQPMETADSVGEGTEIQSLDQPSPPRPEYSSKPEATSQTVNVTDNEDSVKSQAENITDNDDSSELPPVLTPEGEIQHGPCEEENNLSRERETVEPVLADQMEQPEGAVSNERGAVPKSNYKAKQSTSLNNDEHNPESSDKYASNVVDTTKDNNQTEESVAKTTVSKRTLRKRKMPTRQRLQDDLAAQSLLSEFKEEPDDTNSCLPKTCKCCYNEFQNEEEYTCHIIVNIGRKPAQLMFRCPSCCNCFTSMTALKTHIDITHMYEPAAMICMLCKKSFSNKSQLEQHLATENCSGMAKLRGDVNGGGSDDEEEPVETGYDALTDVEEAPDKPAPLPDAAPLPGVKKEAEEGVGGTEDEEPNDQTYSPYKKSRRKAKPRGLSRFRCQLCGRRFRGATFLKNHVRRCTATSGESGLICKFCGKTFQEKTALARHEGMHSSSRHRPHKCPHCSKSYLKRSHLTEHIRSAHEGGVEGGVVGVAGVDPGDDEFPLRCRVPGCDRTFIRKSSRTVHERYHDVDKSSPGSQGRTRSQRNSETSDTPREYACDQCQQVCTSKAKLKSHKMTHESEVECEFCSQKFVNRYVLKKHRKIHTGDKNLACEYCGKMFRELRNLKVHLMTHTGEKPHGCTICDKRFITAGELKMHIRVHTGEKPNTCEYCGMVFTQKGNLSRHLLRHTGERPLKCEICGKGFIEKQEFIAHMNNHNGVKPYKCDVCELAFTRHHHMKKHYRTHTGVKPHKCEFCGKAFAERYNLQTHRIIHTGVKPHPCPFCSTGFIRKGHLVKHVREAHPGQEFEDTPKYFIERKAPNAPVRVDPNTLQSIDSQDRLDTTTISQLEEKAKEVLQSFQLARQNAHAVTSANSSELYHHPHTPHSLGHSGRDSLGHSVRDSLGHSGRDSLGHSVRDSLGHSGRDVYSHAQFHSGDNHAGNHTPHAMSSSGGADPENSREHETGSNSDQGGVPIFGPTTSVLAPSVAASIASSILGMDPAQYSLGSQSESPHLSAERSPFLPPEVDLAAVAAAQHGGVVGGHMTHVYPQLHPSLVQHYMQAAVASGGGVSTSMAANILPGARAQETLLSHMNRLSEMHQQQQQQQQQHNQSASSGAGFPNPNIFQL